MNNRGSAVVEMSLIVPILFGIFVLVLTLFLDTVRDSLIQQEGHTQLYTFDERLLRGSSNGNLQVQNHEQLQAPDYENEIGILMDHKYLYEKEGHCFSMETGVCCSRLRRWQLYGNIIWE